jgi:DegV family protein with EDD domain
LPVGQVRVVTDSTSDLPPDIAERLSITVVPAYIQVGDASYQDGTGLSRQDLYTLMAEKDITPTTAVPPAADFAAAFRALARQADEIVTVTLAAALSGMFSVAELATRDVPEATIHVVDSEQLSMGLGWMAIAAAEAAQDGATGAEIVNLLESIKPRVRVYAMLDTLQYLHRGGRVSWTRAKAAQILRVKPILQVYGGRVDNVGQTRTRRRAFDRLIQMTQEVGEIERLAVIHSYAPEVEELRQALSSFYPREKLVTAPVTTIIGTHAGPRALGVALVASQ